MPQSKSSVLLDIAPNEDVMPEEDDFQHLAEPDAPFHILILGDFSGRKNRGLHAPLAGRQPVLVDRDNLDHVLSGFNAELKLPDHTLKFREMEDFHPDRLPKYREERYREERHREEPEKPVVQTSLPDPSGGSLLDQILAESGDVSPEPIEPTGDLASFIQKSMAPHLAPRMDPRQHAHEQSAASVVMRAILHDPDFQALEAAWRAVRMLVRGLDTDRNLKLYLFDATLEELAADLAGTTRVLTVRKEPWAVVAGNYAFGQTSADAQMLQFLARLSRRIDAPFLAEALPPSDEAVAPEWTILRKSFEAQWIGLALPRFLLRLPYGKDTSSIESFEFEEMPESVHQQYLWGNPAFCCAYLLGQSFLEDGWSMRPGSVRRIDGMPLHVYRENDETNLKPCAEILMTERLADSLMEQGIMPLASLKEQDAILLVRFQSIADPAKALTGRWSA